MIKKIIRKSRENFEITFDEMKSFLKSNSDIVLLDVRSEQEYKEGHIRGAINIPIYELNNKLETVLQNKNQTIIVYCLSGVRSRKALKILKKYNYKNVFNLKDGIKEQSSLALC